MNDKPENKTLNDGQMDQLLSTFYKTELPAELQNPPSTWPAIKEQANRQSPASPVIADSDHVRPVVRSSASRGLVVAASTLAACLVIAALNNAGSQPGPALPATADKAESGEMMNVSENADGVSGVIDESGLTVEELDVDLSPPEKTVSPADSSGADQP